MIHAKEMVFISGSTAFTLEVKESQVCIISN